MTTEIVKPDAEMLDGVSRAEIWARDLVITTAEECTAANEMVKRAMRERAAFVEFFSDSKKKSDALHKAICKQERYFTSRYDVVIKAGKAGMLTHKQAEARKAEAERQRLQAIEDERVRKEREAAEAEAEKQRKIEADARAKAEAAREAAAELERQKEAERDAEPFGDPEQEKKDAAEVARLAEVERLARLEADAAAYAARIKAEKAARAEAETVIVKAELPADKGTYTVRKWKAKLTDKDALIESAHKGNPVAAAFLAFDEKAANKFAVKNQDSMPCPGIEFYADENLAVRKK